MIETIPKMRARHRKELVTAIQEFSDAGITQGEAAKGLGISLSNLNGMAKRYGVRWLVRRQGRRTEKNTTENVMGRLMRARALAQCHRDERLARCGR